MLEASLPSLRSPRGWSPALVQSRRECANLADNVRRVEQEEIVHPGHSYRARVRNMLLDCRRLRLSQGIRPCEVRGQRSLEDNGAERDTDRIHYFESKSMSAL